jgi:hypothetical protein
MPRRSLAPLAVLRIALPAARRTAPPYVPRTRDVVITAVPLLTKEMQAISPFLKQDFAPGGGVTVMTGDRQGLTLPLPGESRARRGSTRSSAAFPRTRR